MFTPIFLPMHESEPEKIKCPKCKHRFVPEEEHGVNILVPIFLWIATVVIGLGCFGMSLIVGFEIPMSMSDKILGGYIIGFVVSVAATLLILILE